MKQFSCGAVVPGCTATFTAEDEDGILAQVAGHAKEEHGIDEPGPDLVAAVKEKIEEVPA